MAPNKELTRISKKLALILRHKPESFNIKLDKNGWAQTSDILKALNINMSILETIVVTDNKGRYAFDEYKKRIRAVQGHSIVVDLNLVSAIPPDSLYHGTAKRNIGSIMSKGINKISRQYVHLSTSFETAVTVGTRHGEAVVFRINTKAMRADGISFYRAENGVWLTEYIDPKYISLVYDDTTPDD